MPVTFEFLPDIPLLIVRGQTPLEEVDAVQTMQQVIALKAQFPGKKIYRLMDFTKGIDFSGMVMCMAAERGQEGGANDPVVMSFFVGDNALVELGVKALKDQPQYGQPTVFLFTSYEEAYNRALAEAKAQ
jgi:hypothetical protein